MHKPAIQVENLSHTEGEQCIGRIDVLADDLFINTLIQKIYLNIWRWQILVCNKQQKHRSHAPTGHP